MLHDREKIWNRAAVEGGGQNAGKGDKALSSLLLAHGLVMNGGLYHAMESMSQMEIVDAIEGYEYFSLDEEAGVLKAALKSCKDELEVLETTQGGVFADEYIINAFNEKYQKSPDDFAPLQ